MSASVMSAEISVLVLIAMEAEASPLLAALELPETALDHPWAPCKAYSGVFKGMKVSVVTNGKWTSANAGEDPVDNVGTTPAAIAAFVAISQFQPTLIINAGTAGGFKAKGASIGDTFVSTVMRHHDRRITIPGWDNYAKGHHVSHPVDNLREALGFKAGVVTTGNSLDATDRDMEIMASNDASVKDMEAASIAWVAEHAKVPFFALKCVTDIVDGEHPTHEEFVANLSTAAASLQKSLSLTMEYLIGKSPERL